MYDVTMKSPVESKSWKERLSLQPKQRLVCPEREKRCDHIDCLLDCNGCNPCIPFLCYGPRSAAQALWHSLLCKLSLSLSLSDCVCLFSKRLMEFWSWIGVQTFVAWLDLVTYLHHHGHDEKLPWYRGKVKLLGSLYFLTFNLGELVIRCLLVVIS